MFASSGFWGWFLLLRFRRDGDCFCASAALLSFGNGSWRFAIDPQLSSEKFDISLGVEIRVVERDVSDSASEEISTCLFVCLHAGLDRIISSRR